ncbi:MAG: lysophospholipid acyltransferase family protein [Dehalococcoidia bacterium]|nr:lysophospholipid acyltransferase family protein [Dehalococcoidia bacterium]
MSKLFKFCELSLNTTFNIFGKIQVLGSQNIPKDDSVISVSNHLSIIDPPLCASAVGKEARFLAKKELFKFPINIFLKFYGAFPINRGKVDLKAFQWSKKQLMQKNNSLLIFPEGTRSKNYVIKKGYNGVTFLAIENDSIILPLGITGSEKCTNYLQFFFPKMKIIINIGKPFKIINLPKEKNKILYDKITKEIMQRISNLLPENYKNEKKIIAENNFIYTKIIGEI